ncbi:MAG: STAS domain-containing protein [Verrucomicrobiaceae bacterium]|jgi:anti-anti-sigma regulatory factor|nr:STAS domain-containing protein [Verrucomicrobiaceae bacterium]
MNTPSTRILVGQVGRVFWMRVDGKGTHLNSLQARNAFQGVMARGVHDLVVDLERCPMMDSTFLGMLTGAALSVKKDASGGTLSIVNANQRNIQLLTSLGLNHILDLDVEGRLWASERAQAARALKICEEAAACSKEVQTQHILDAHQTLSGISDENECRFRDVIDFLEKELHAQTASSPVPA